MDKAQIDVLFPYPSDSREHYVEDILQFSRAPDNEEDCPICQEPWDEDNWVLSGTHCHHIFHRTCLMDWFYSDRANHNRCPYCRSKCWPTLGERAAAEDAAEPLINEALETAQATWAVGTALEEYPDTGEVGQRLSQILNAQNREDPIKDAADHILDRAQQYVRELPSNWMESYLQFCALAEFVNIFKAEWSFDEWLMLLRKRDDIWKQSYRRFVEHIPNNHVCVYNCMEQNLPFMQLRIPLSRRYGFLGKLQKVTVKALQNWANTGERYELVPPGTLILGVSDDYQIKVDSQATTADIVEITVKSVGVLKTVVGANEETSMLIGDADGLAHVLDFSYEHGDRIRDQIQYPHP
jgi:hypothetical protein